MVSLCRHKKAKEKPPKKQDEVFILCEQRNVWLTFKARGNALPSKEGGWNVCKQQRQKGDMRGMHRLTSLALALPETLAVNDGEGQKHQYDDDQGTAGQSKQGCVLWRHGGDCHFHQVCSGPTCTQQSEFTAWPEAAMLQTTLPAPSPFNAMNTLLPAHPCGTQAQCCREQIASLQWCRSTPEQL